MKLPRDSRVLRNRLKQAMWDANHNGEKALDAIFDAIETYMAGEAAAPVPCCKDGAKLAEDWVTRYKCPKHGWQDEKPSADATVPEPWLIVAAHLSTEGVTCFWGPKFSGYTSNLHLAGRYTEEQARSREVWSERMEVAVPLSEAEVAQFPAVRDDDAHAWFHRRFPDGRPAPHVPGDPCYCRGGTNLRHSAGDICPASQGQLE